jgi:hypothetical protein
LRNVEGRVSGQGVISLDEIFDFLDNLLEGKIKV